MPPALLCFLVIFWIYVKNSRKNALCSRPYSLEQNATDIELKIDAQQLVLCGFRIWPKPNSKKSLLSAQIIISFHRSLVTPSDRSFAAHCEFDDFQRDADIPVDNLIQSHELILGNFDTPEVTMRILPSGETNSVENLKPLKVGDPITFEWTLTKHSEIFGIELERCSAETEDGKGMKIIENGCSLDDELISDAQTVADHSKIFANSLAFKFPEEHVVWIRCAVRTCVRRSEHLEIIDGSEGDLCESESSCGFGPTQRNRRQLAKNNASRTDIIFVNGRFQIARHRHFEHLKTSSSTSRPKAEFCMPDVIYYTGIFAVAMCYVITISTTVMWKCG
uniref:ZP domain-containing protein n=1 Tax=Caenorhabditis japonica TaxID=281687 RepID=A0A8R1DUS8_CAEJA